MKKHKCSVFKVECNIFAQWEKREGGEFMIERGDYKECVDCGGGLFVPLREGLSVVPCDKIYAVASA